MILINLLPHREERRNRRRVAFYIGMGVAAVIGLGAVGLWYAGLQQMISMQQSRNDFISAEIKRLESQISDIATLRAEIEALKARQKAVEDLQTDRNTPVYLLNELVKQTPEGVYLSSIKQQDQQVVVAGVAQSNERVSEFLRNTANSSQWLEKPELVEIKAADVLVGAKEKRRLFEFSLKVMLKRAAVIQGAASSASAASSAQKTTLPSATKTPA